ncbi:MAG: 30S ribosomal protein S21 [bacterium]
MVITVVRKGESLDNALKRFKRKCLIAGVQRDFKKNAYYLKPSEKKKVARRRNARRYYRS